MTFFVNAKRLRYQTKRLCESININICLDEKVMNLSQGQNDIKYPGPPKSHFFSRMYKKQTVKKMASLLIRNVKVITIIRD